jgi:hypothetical protein
MVTSEWVFGAQLATPGIDYELHLEYSTGALQQKVISTWGKILQKLFPKSIHHIQKKIIS